MQPVTFGVQAGAPALTPLGEAGNGMPFVLGPTMTFRIFSRLSLETGVLFQRMGQRSDTGAFQYPENALTLRFDRERGNAVELPILAKYYVVGERHIWRPFLAAGPTVRPG